MTFTLSAKAEYIAENAPGSTTVYLRRVFSKIIQRLPSEPNHAPALWTSLELDLLYLIFKHRAWLATPLLESVAVEFLMSEYRVSRDSAEQLVGEMLVAARKIIQIDPSRNQSDKEFLRYILVLSISSLSEAEIEAELGLGRGLLLRLKTAADTVIDDESTSISFLPEVDSLFAELIHEISEKMQKNPWIADVYRIEYLLTSVPESLQLLFGKLGYEWLFEVIMHLSSQKQFSTEFVQSYFGSNDDLPMTTTDFADLGGVEGLLGYLQSQNFVFQIGKSGASEQWQTTAVAQKLCATAFAAESNKTLTIGFLKALNPAFQRAVIGNFTSRQVPLILEIVKSTKFPLHPSAVDPLAEKLVEELGEQRVVELLTSFLDQPNSWLRKSICQTLSNRCGESARTILTRVSSDDASQGVREVAGIGLIHLDDAGASEAVIGNG
jgi:hypothetical protein